MPSNPWDVTGRGGGARVSSRGPSSGKLSPREELREILAGLSPPKFISAIGKELAQLPGLAPVTRRIPKKFLPESKRKEILEGQKAIPRAIEAFQTGGVKEGAAQLLEAPGVRLVPGTFVGSQTLRGRLEERPLSALLDILPYAGKASRIATLGTKAGLTATSRAATRAAAAGKVAKAERIMSRGLEPRNLVGELVRSSQDALINRFPARERLLRPVETLGMGGRIRDLMKVQGILDRRLQTKAKQHIDEVFAESKNRDISPQRVNEISAIAQAGGPLWRQKLTRAERSWVTWYETRAREVSKSWLDEGLLFEHGGELYSTSGHKALYDAVRAAERAAKAVDEARAGGGPYKNFFERPARLERQAQGLREELVSSFETRFRTPEETATLGARVQKLQDQARQERALVEQRLNQIQREAEKTVSRRAQRAVPTRFRPLVEERTRQAAAALTEQSLKGTIDDATLDTLLDDLLEGDYSAANLTRAQVRDIRKPIKNTWQKLRSAGYDPIYLHHVGIEDAQRLLGKPRAGVVAQRPGFTKQLSWDASSHIPNMEVALSAQGVEHYMSLVARDSVPLMQKAGLLYTAGELDDILRRTVPREQGAGKFLDVRARRTAIKAKNYEQFDPNSIFPLKKARVQLPAGEQTLFVHKNLANALRRTMKQADLGAMARAAERGGKIFRFSVLYMNPFYYLGNIVSNVHMGMMHKPDMLRWFPRAARTLRRGTLPEEISRGPQIAGVESVRRSRAWQEGSRLGQELQAELSRLPRARNALRTLTGLPQRFAGLIDDMGRAMAFLSEQKSALKQGMSAETARQAGIELAQKVYGDLDRLTPVERAITRSLMGAPFYAWNVHILRFVGNYPFDHPWRAAVVSNVSRAFFEDWPEELPARFKNDLIFDKESKRIGLTGLFPLQAIPDLLSVQGFLNRMNPTAQTLFEFTGADPFTLGPSVFGARETRFDPVSGRQVAVRPSFIEKAIEGISPQVGFLVKKVRSDPEWLEFMATNPEAARAAAWRAFGIPIPRDIDIQEEIEKYQEQLERQLAAEERREAKLLELEVTTGQPRGGGSNPYDVTR